MLAHGHSLDSITKIDDIRMRNIVQMWVDGQINGRANTDLLVNVIQAIHGAVGSKSVPKYSDISPNTYSYIVPPPTVEEQMMIDHRNMVLHMQMHSDNIPESLLATIR